MSRNHHVGPPLRNRQEMPASRPAADRIIQNRFRNLNLDPILGPSSAAAFPMGPMASGGGGRGGGGIGNRNSFTSPTPGRLFSGGSTTFDENMDLGLGSPTGSKRRYSERALGNVNMPAGIPLAQPIPSGSATSTSSKLRNKFGGNYGPKPRKDLSNYKPIKTFSLQEENTRVYTAPNGITDETIVVTSGQESLIFYRLKITEFKNDGESKPTQFELIKVHEVEFEEANFGQFSISSKCSLTLPPRQLVYAVSTFWSPIVYFFDFKEEHFLPEKVTIGRVDLIEKHDYSMQIFENTHPTLHIALKNDHYLACVLENRVVVVWDIFAEDKLCSFQLSSEGVHISWHPSENFKLMVVEAKGYVKFFNVMKERCYMCQFMCHLPLYSGDWAYSNTLMSAVGWGGGISCFNSAQSNTNMFKVYEQPCKAFKRVQFNPTDETTIATLERGYSPPGTIRLWKSHFPRNMWSYTNKKVMDMAWVFGKPFLIAIGSKKFFIFDASTNA